MLEKLLTGPNLIFLGLLLWSGMLLRGAATKSRRSRSRNVVQEVRTELQLKQRSAESQISRLEVRLHDYDRDVAARVETTMAFLDQLIQEADREIVRLETLLAERQAEPGSALDSEQRRMVVHLAQAGYSITEIARLVDRPIEQISLVLKDDHPPHRRAA